MAGPCGRIRIMTVHDIHFSARGTTASYARAVCTSIGLPTISSNWLRREERREVDISHDDLLVFSMPVYGGFIPALCRDSAVLLQGHDTPAIIVAVYGNRHYDDALVQMRTLLEERGFTVVAGAAFVARHSIFPSVAADRPDDDDLDEARSFAKRALESIGRTGRLALPGREDHDSLVFKGSSFHPCGDDRCIRCMACAGICPTGAVDRADPCMSDTSACISCGACIDVCPVSSRGYHDEAYKAAETTFAAKCSGRRKNEIFLL